MTILPTTGRPALTVAIGDTWQPRYIVYFGMALTGLVLLTNILNLKFVNLFGITVISSMLTYTFSLILTDIMAEVYGYRRVRKLLYFNVCILIFYAVITKVAVLLPPAPSYPNNEAFRTVFEAAPRVVVASIAAHLAVELVNSAIMSRLKIRFTARYFYGRAVTSVVSPRFLTVPYSSVSPIWASCRSRISCLRLFPVG